MDINVLLITASLDHARSVKKALAGNHGGSFHVQCISRLPDDLGHLRDGAATVLLLDLLLPDVRGIGALDRLLAAAPQIPILVFGSVSDEQLGRQAVQRGAQDYLPSNHLDDYTLPRALRHVIERKAADDILFLEQERAQVTLDSIADAVLSIDAAGKVTYLNSVAEKLLGWPRGEAKGLPLVEVFRIIDGKTRLAPARNPMELAMDENRPVGLAANSVLVRRDGAEIAIEDSAAPIRGRDGEVIGAVMVFHDVMQSQETMARMSHLAHHDFLTDLPNHALFGDRLAQAIALAHRREKQLAVLYVDLDRFKDVNDTLGHDTGDKLLQSAARRLSGCLRRSDSVSRKGGDEFVVLLPEIAHADHASRSAEKIIAAVKEAHRIGGQELMVTASIGIGIYPLDGTDAESLLKSADAAMYEAKAAGRNQYRAFRQGMNAAGRERRANSRTGLPPSSAPALACIQARR
jgi:diguanylate cyclase (GGDEF)-like protein/PAS domain S-box-containing protein